MDQSTGFVKVPRSMLASPIWNNPYDCMLFLYCLLNASHNFYRGLRPGEFYTSKPRMMEELHWSKNTLKEHMKRLEELRLISYSSSPSGTVICVSEWEIFAGGQGQEMTPIGQQMIHSGQQMTHSSQDMTLNGQQMTFHGQQMTPNRSADDPNQEYTKNKSTISMREQAFEEWWIQYPRHEQKSAAKKAWMAMVDVSPERLNAALKNARMSAQWLEAGGRFIPRADKWLDGKWEDYEPKVQEIRKDGNNGWTEY